MSASSFLIRFAVTLSYSLFFFVSADKIPTTPPAMIDAICKPVSDFEGCRRTVAENPDAASAKDLVSMARAVIGIGIKHASETLDFIRSTMKTDPTVKTTFMRCAGYYANIFKLLKVAAGEELTEAPMLSNYLVMRSLDETSMTVDALGASKGGASENALMEKTRQMNSFIDLAVGATDAVEKYFGEK